MQIIKCGLNNCACYVSGAQWLCDKLVDVVECIVFFSLGMIFEVAFSNGNLQVSRGVAALRVKIHDYGFVISLCYVKFTPIQRCYVLL